MKKQHRQNPAEETKIYLTPDSTLQTPEEHEHDASVDPRNDQSISVSRDDVNETDTDRYRDDIYDAGQNNDRS